MSVYIPVHGALYFLRSSMAGAKELNYFPTEQQRQDAIDSILRRPLTWYEGVLFFIAIALIFPQTGWTFVGWPIWKAVDAIVPLTIARWHGVIAYYLVTLVVLFVALRVYHRRTTRRRVLYMLLGAGIPVCKKCGYDLRGQAMDAEECSECGHKYGYWVMRAIADTQKNETHPG